MKIFGHPLHMMLIHFPSALFPMDFVCSLIAYYYGDTSFVNASFYSMAGGVILGFAAIVTGTFDLLGVMKEEPAALKKALIHGGINTTVIIAYCILALIAFKNFPDLAPDTLPEILFKGGLLTFMILGNFLGGSLILKHHIGIEKRKHVTNAA